MVSLGAASRLPPLFSLLMQLTGIRSVMPIIKFIKEKKEIEVPRGANLRKAALEAGIGAVYIPLSALPLHVCLFSHTAHCMRELRKS